MSTPSAEIDAVHEAVIEGMTPPPGGPDDPFWQGAQWAYGQVRYALDASRDPSVIPPGKPFRHEREDWRRRWLSGKPSDNVTTS